jgi:hypothetical protein
LLTTPGGWWRDRYFNNLEVLTHYEANQPVEVLQSQVNGLLKDAFLSRNVLVYNEFRGSANSYSTVEEYVKDCRIFTSGNPVSNTLAMKMPVTRLAKTKTGFHLSICTLRNGRRDWQVAKTVPVSESG